MQTDIHSDLLFHFSPDRVAFSTLQWTNIFYQPRFWQRNSNHWPRFTRYWKSGIWLLVALKNWAINPTHIYRKFCIIWSSNGCPSLNRWGLLSSNGCKRFQTVISDINLEMLYSPPVIGIDEFFFLIGRVNSIPKRKYLKYWNFNKNSFSWELSLKNISLIGLSITHIVDTKPKTGPQALH